MKTVQKIDLKSFIRQVKSEGISMRRRFILYIISAIILVLSLILLLLNIFGNINPAGTQILDVLDTQLISYADNIKRDYDRAAAHAISFSEQLEKEINDYLTEKSLRFENLKNNAEALSSLQNVLYDTVYLHMQLAPASGAFYILDTTVNSATEGALFNGIYLKYVNLYSASTVNNEITLYRGSFSTAKKGNLTFHSGWNNEMRTDFFEICDSVFTDGVYYSLSPTVEIPDTWERARYVYVPIRDSKENTIGVCGFEINDLYFQLSQTVHDDQYGQLIGAILDEQQGIYAGQFNSGHYNTLAKNGIKVTEKKKTVEFAFENENGIGKTRPVKLGDHTFVAALMMPQVQFDALVLRGQMQTTAIIITVMLVMLAYCLFISRKYMSPILRKIEKIKYRENDGELLKIPEIDDLFAYFEKRSLMYEEQLKVLQSAKEAAEDEVLRSRMAYEKALEAYELAQNEIVHLSEESQNEIVLEDYEYFICNLKTLTPRELRIYELYIDGKSTAEIASIIGIKENTMKYHNKNIYSKLGISSRKQLLRFAALKQYQDKNGIQNP